MANRAEGIADVYINDQQAAQSLKQLEDKAEKLNNQLNKMRKANDKLGFDKTKKELDQVNREMKSYRKSTSDVKRVLDNLSGASYNQLVKAQRQIRKEMRGMKRDNEESNRVWKQKQQQLSRVDKELTKVQKDMKYAGAETNKFGQIARKVGPYLAAAFSFGAITGLISNVVRVRKEFETYAAVLTNTLGSKSKSQEALRMIQKFAANTPFQVAELTGSFVKLANQGFKPTRDEMRKLGDVAASTGKGFDQLAEAIIDAQVGEFERLKEFGIRAQKQGDQVTFTFKGVKEQVDFTEESIQKYLLSLGDVQGVSGSMSAISQTLEGKISNLGDAWDSLFNTLGKLSGGILMSVVGGIADLVGWTEKLISNSPSEMLQQQQVDVNNLVMELTNANTQEARKVEIWEILNDKAPEVIENIDKQNISVSQLAENMRLYNEQMIKKIALQDSEDALDNERKKAGLAAQNRLDKEIELIDKLNEIKNKVAEEDEEAAERLNEIILSNIDVREKEAKIREMLHEGEMGEMLENRMGQRIILAQSERLSYQLARAKGDEKRAQDEVNNALLEYTKRYDILMGKVEENGKKYQIGSLEIDKDLDTTLSEIDAKYEAMYAELDAKGESSAQLQIEHANAINKAIADFDNNDDDDDKDKDAGLTPEELAAILAAKQKALEEYYAAINNLDDQQYRDSITKEEQELLAIDQKYQALYEKADAAGQDTTELQAMHAEELKNKVLEIEEAKNEELKEKERQAAEDRFQFRKQHGFLKHEELMQQEIDQFTLRAEQLKLSEEELQQGIQDIKDRYADEGYQKEQAEKDKLLKLKEDEKKEKIALLNQYSNMARDIVGTISDFYQAAMNRELAAAGDNEEKKEQIREKYAKKQQNMAVIDAIISGAAGIVKTGMNLGYPPAIPFQIIQAAQTAAQIEIIKSQQFASGKYDVIGASDGRTYQAGFVPQAATGIYNEPTMIGGLGLVGERAPELVVDGPTLSNMQLNAPELIEAIHRMRVPQFAGGNYASAPPLTPPKGEEPASAASAVKDLARLESKFDTMIELLGQKTRAYVTYTEIKDVEDEINDIKNSVSK